MECEHREFNSACKIVRLIEDDESGVPKPVSNYVAEMKVWCSECGMEFQFIGPGAGVSYNEPRVSADKKELRIPIKPSDDPIDVVNQIIKQ